MRFKRYFFCAVLSFIFSVGVGWPKNEIDEDAPYTGLVIDAVGFASNAGIAPKIYDEKGKLLYEDGGDLPHVIGSAGTLSSALRDPRVGSHPLVVYASALRHLKNGYSSVLLVSQRDGDAILRHNRKSHFLENGYVLFVTTPVIANAAPKRLASEGPAALTKQAATLLKKRELAVRHEAALLKKQELAVRHEAAMLKKREELAVRHEAAVRAKHEEAMRHEAALQAKHEEAMRHEAALQAKHEAALRHEAALQAKHETALQHEAAQRKEREQAAQLEAAQRKEREQAAQRELAQLKQREQETQREVALRGEHVQPASSTPANAQPLSDWNLDEEIAQKIADNPILVGELNFAPKELVRLYNSLTAEDKIEMVKQLHTVVRTPQGRLDNKEAFITGQVHGRSFFDLALKQLSDDITARTISQQDYQKSKEIIEVSSNLTSKQRSMFVTLLEFDVENRDK